VDYPNLLAIFSYDPGVSFFVSTTGTATAYTSTFDTVNSELLPSARQIKGGQTISIVTPNPLGGNVQVSFYAVNAYTN
jgi:hypothetical protein